MRMDFDFLFLFRLVFGKADEAGFYSSIVKLSQETSQQIERIYMHTHTHTEEPKATTREEMIKK